MKRTNLEHTLTSLKGQEVKLDVLRCYNLSLLTSIPPLNNVLIRHKNGVKLLLL